MRKAHTADLLVFFDDDFLADPNYLAEIERLFSEHSDIVIATGRVLADGISGPGINVDEGLRILNDVELVPQKETLASAYNGYGCNMTVRLDVALRHCIEFDENLPLYGWWEDVDFSRRLRPFGRIIRSNRLLGVHLGSKLNRSPGKRLGYSQVANPVYLQAKGSISWFVAAKRVVLNVAANVGRSCYPEPWIDRRGRLVGNVIAFSHLLKGIISPEHASKL